MEGKSRSILVSGWRGIPHSYAVATQFWCLELLRRPGIELFFEDVPYWRESWQPHTGIFSPEDEAALAAIPEAADTERLDGELRTAIPHDLVTPPRAKRVCTFITSEWGLVQDGFIIDGIPLRETHRLHDGTFEIVTSSVWARDGVLQSGADPDRTHVVPLGVDERIFHPPTDEERAAAREKLKIASDEFVFYSAGAMVQSKGIGPLLRTFLNILPEFPNARLLLKGLESLFPSYTLFKHTMLRWVDPADLGRLFSRMTYIGDSMSFEEMAGLYHAADCYVSPYSAEGFNLPALEAVACGLPLIATAGGATDDYTTEDFCLRIHSRHEDGFITGEDNKRYDAYWLVPDEAHLTELMRLVIADKETRARALAAGPEHVVKNYLWKHSVDKLLDVMFR